MIADDQDQLLKDAVAAIVRGDGSQARRLLGEAGDDPHRLFLLAQACRVDGDDPATRSALDRLLAIRPRHVGALLMQGDACSRGGDRASAAFAFRAALGIVAEAHGRGEAIPAALTPELDCAQRWLADEARAQSQLIEEALSDGGFPVGQRSELIDETLALLRGDVRIQLQRPRNLYVPGLPQRAFYERDEVPWVPELESSTAAIRGEVSALLDGAAAGFVPYIPADADRSDGRAPNAHLAGDASWSAYYLWRDGAVEPEGADRCPSTMAALAQVPLVNVAGRSPMALFSLLRPGAHIRPHYGLFNFRLICHLPLIVPADCSLRVGNRIRDWREGELLIFDDSMEHEAWNRSPSLRAILLFEIWHPEIGEADREALTLLLGAAQMPFED